VASQVYEIFKQAILNKQQIVCIYQNRPREICPHTLGMKAGQEKVLTFQFGGQSSSGLPPGGEWRCLFLAQVQNAQIRDGTWHTGPNHSRPQTCVDDIDVEVTF
jgi:hypothetical protein